MISESSSGMIIKNSNHFLSKKLKNSSILFNSLPSSTTSSAPLFSSTKLSNSLNKSSLLLYSSHSSSSEENPFLYSSPSSTLSSTLLASKFPPIPSFNSTYFTNSSSIFNLPSRNSSFFPTFSSKSLTSQSFPISTTTNLPSLKNFFHLFFYTEKFLTNFTTILIKDPDLNRIITKIISYSLWIYILLSFFGTIGIDTKPLISLISIIIFTLGLAGKDLLTNSLTGFFILFSKPFKRGDIISINNYKGKVISIDIRFVRLIEMNDDEIEEEREKDKDLSFISTSSTSNKIIKNTEKEILLPLSTVYNNPIIILKRIKKLKDIEKKNDY